MNGASTSASTSASTIASSHIYYEHVVDDYWYGVQGGCRLLIDRNNGYFNATKLCRDNGRHFYHWGKNKNSQVLVSLLRFKGVADNITRTTVGAAASAAGKEQQQQGRSEEEKVVSDYKSVKGTYVPKELLLNVALWISPECYIQCSNIIQDFVVYGIRVHHGVDASTMTDDAVYEAAAAAAADRVGAEIRRLREEGYGQDVVEGVSKNS